MNFKVGDRVRSRQPGREYTGTIKKIGPDSAYVKIDDGDSDWQCRIVGDKVATAEGVWDEKSFLEHLSGRPSVVKPTKFVAFYDEDDHDPMKEFTDEKELKAWLEEAKEDDDIEWSSIRVFEVAHELKIQTSFTLKKV